MQNAMRAFFAEATAQFLRRNRKIPTSTTRNIVFTCHGERPLAQAHNLLTFGGQGQSISEDALFQYTNGRFLVDEEQQLLKRHLKFDVRKLCDVVTSLTENGAPVCKIDKMEGGFSKALLITTEDGMEVVAKIPCLNAGRAKYSTASEAAVLEYGVVAFHLTRAVTKLTGPSELTYQNTCSEVTRLECRFIQSGRCGIYYHGESSRHSAFQSLG